MFDRRGRWGRQASGAKQAIAKLNALSIKLLLTTSFASIVFKKFEIVFYVGLF